MSAGEKMGQPSQLWPRVLALALVLLALAIARPEGGASDQSLQRVRQAGVLVVGLDASYPPFETTDGSGNYGGFDVLLAQEIARRLGVAAQFANISFDSLYDALHARRIDIIISSLRYEAERTRDVRYTTPYLDAGHVLIVRSGEPWAKLADLAGPLGVEQASETDVQARKLASKVRGLTVQAYPTIEEALVALEAGALQAVATDYVTALSLVKGKAHLRVVLPPFSADLLVMAVHEQDRTLLREINRIVRQLDSEGMLSRLAAQAF